MISAINNVSFGNNQDLINSPGQFSATAIPENKPDTFEMEDENKKSNNGLKALLGTALVALAAFVGLGVAVKKGNLVKVDVPAEGFMAKVKAKVKNFGFSVGEQAKKCYEKVAGWFSKGEKATKTESK